MGSHSKSWRILTALVVVSMLGVSCSGSVSFSIGGKSPEAAAEGLIEGELANKIGIVLTAECPDLEDAESGDVFTCAGTTIDGEVIDFIVDIAEDEVFANSQNVLVGDSIRGFEDSIVTTLNQANDGSLPSGSVDCGVGPLIVPRTNEVQCRLSDPSSNDVYDTIVTITDQTNWQYSVSVAEDPS